MKRFFSLRYLFSLILLAFILIRAHLSLVRYIDPDEFAYLHWAYIIGIGNIPYKDFFINLTPIYFWILAPLVGFIQSADILIVSRLFQLSLILCISYFVYRLTKLITKQEIPAYLATIIFLAFPMILDKTIEIRPDTFMTVLYIMAFSMALEGRKTTTIKSLLIGIIASSSVLALFKIIYGIPSILLLLLLKSPRNERVKHLAIFMIGILIPIALSLWYLASTNTVSLAWENIVHGSLLIKRGEGAFSPFKSWSAYPLVYVNDAGISLPWILNSSLWMAGIAGLIVLLKKNSVAGIGILCFLGLGIVSLFLFPTPYLQYFIPLSAFVSVLVAVFIQTLTGIGIGGIKQIFTHVFLLGFIGILGSSLLLQYSQRTVAGADNAEQTNVIRDILTLTKSNESVYDMVGSYIFRPDGYYICCNIYSQFANDLHIKLPTLQSSLVSHATKFIILDRSGKSLWRPFPDDLRYLKTNYLPTSKPKIYSLGLQFFCTDGICTRLDAENKPVQDLSVSSFQIFIPETYSVVLQPDGTHVTIDNRPINTDSIYLSGGNHSFTVPSALTHFRLQLAR